MLANNYLNNIGKASSRFGNYVGAAVVLYIAVGKTLNFVFQEELENFNEMQRSALFGAMTGGLYKSTRGLRASVLSSFLGAGCGCAFVYMWNKGFLQVKLK